MYSPAGFHQHCSHLRMSCFLSPLTLATYNGQFSDKIDFNTQWFFLRISHSLRKLKAFSNKCPEVIYYLWNVFIQLEFLLDHIKIIVALFRIFQKSSEKNSILFWPTVRKNCSSGWEKLLKFEAEGWEFAKILRSLEQFIQTVKGQNNFW